MKKDYRAEFAADFEILDSRYSGLESYVKQMAGGNIRSLIVNGHPGIGKTYAVTKYLDQCAPGNHFVVSGRITLLALYAALFHYRAKGKILVLDDVDSIFGDIQGLNILKAAMDTTTKRKIHWASTTGVLNTMGIPNNFEFNGGVILISNVGFGGGTSKLVAHLTALKDRSFCVPVADSGEDSLFKQVCYMVLERGLMTSMGVAEADQQMLLEYIEEKKSDLSTVSLRTVSKLVNIFQIDPQNWRLMADQGMLKA